jgi:hypothetical protein
MVKIQGRFTSYGKVWFDQEIPSDPGVDLLILHQRSSPIAGRNNGVFMTLVSDLTLDEQDLFSTFNRTTRYKIKRAETKDDLTFAHFGEPLPHLGEFCEFYDAFARQKGLYPCYRPELAALGAQGRLSLSSASREGEPLVWHAYVTIDDTASLLYTASHYRDKHNEQRALIGRANRALHWRDAQAFKRLGFRRFDWGGMFEDESDPARASVNTFKRDFGGALVRMYGCTIPVTAKGRLVLLARRGLAKLRGWRSRSRSATRLTTILLFC